MWQNSPQSKNCDVISNQPGEGEHKIFQDILKVCSKKENIVIYGSDSDILQLMLRHCDFRHISLVDVEKSNMTIITTDKLMRFIEGYS